MQMKKYISTIKLNLPADYTIDNFDKIKKLFSRIKGEPYSLNIVMILLRK